jgi:FtsH-binding integral membrane protein
MDKFALVIGSIATTALCLGIYGPVLHWGQQGMGHGRLRPFMAVGIAYFLIAIVVPLLLVYLLQQETDPKYAWTWRGTFWSLAGGAAGAIGALGIIMAFNFGGTPAFVMPLVFGCAPIVNTAFTMYFSGAWRNLGNLRGGFYFAGLILVIIGAVMVLTFAPSPAKSPGAHSAKPAPATKDTPKKT